MAMNTSPKHPSTLLLNAEDVRKLFSFQACIEVVEEAFRLYGQGRTLKPELIHIDAAEGQFHIKAGGARDFCAVKINSDFSDNVDRWGLPSILGVIVLINTRNGYPLAIMDASEITLNRTGAATAVAAKYLANPTSDTATICGCGGQGRIQLKALTHVLPIKKAFAFSRNEEKTLRYAREMSWALNIDVEPTDNVEKALSQSGVCVTCTRSTRSFISKENVLPGTFIAAIGADAPEKQELDPRLVAGSKLVVDIQTQCARVGELHHALESGLNPTVHAELGDILCGKKPGRSSADEIIVFDSTGTALQDVAAASAIYKEALSAGSFTNFEFSRPAKIK